MKVLIIGEHYSSNLGDGVICKSVEYLIKEAYPMSDISISDLTSRTGYKIEDTEPELSNNLQRSKKAIKNYLNKFIYRFQYLKYKDLNGRKHQADFIKNTCNDHFDIAVFAGGQLFLDYFCISIERHVKELSKKNVPIIFNACGLGSIKCSVLLGKLINALRHQNIKSITSRDDVYKINKLLLNNSNIIATQSYDPALWASEVFQIQKKKSEVVGLGVIRLNSELDNEVFRIYTNLIKELDKRDIKWELFCNGSETDYELAKEIANYCGKNNSVLAERPIFPRELVNTISRYRSIISCRLHSHIIATSLDIPSIAISWDEKVKFFFENIDCIDRCFDIYVDHSELINKLISAENVGYNKKIIETQKNKLMKTLIENIKSHVRY
ncbi:polysaccharide pyruvyl transferase family protein [Neobacillus drentensis]|uniref:polysaccharide pyruvyl transferase family protein n=1 Tax=Neobacillus drentensis TaxID=220684 RepID=UPI002FFF3CB6